MFCPKCGVQLVSDASPFCTQCGSPVKASAQVPVQAAGVAPTVPVTYLPPTIQAHLAKYTRFVTAICPKCGYSGKVGCNDHALIYWIWVVIGSLLIIVGILSDHLGSDYSGVPLLIAGMFIFGVQAFCGYKCVCPNCQAHFEEQSTLSKVLNP